LLFRCPKAGLPLAQNSLPILVENLRPDLKQQMGTPGRPLHLLLLGHSLAHHLVDSQFDEAGTDPLAITAAPAVVDVDTVFACITAFRALLDKPAEMALLIGRGLPIEAVQATGRVLPRGSFALFGRSLVSAGGGTRLMDAPSPLLRSLRFRLGPPEPVSCYGKRAISVAPPELLTNPQARGYNAAILRLQWLFESSECPDGGPCGYPNER
jgi:hypothetical protein